MQTKTLRGLLGVLGIWLTAGFALPFVKILGEFSLGQLMALRGLLTAGLVLIALRGVVGRVDKYTWLIGLTVPFATLGLFQGIRHWGAGPTITIITATPLVNLAIGTLSGCRVSGASIIGLILVLGGVVIARWGGHFQWEGLAWSTFGTIMNGITYEWFSRATAGKFQKCFFGSMGMGLLGFLLSADASWRPLTEPHTLVLVLGFVFVGGFLYWLANLLAFENLPTVEASVLAQGETPAVIVSAGILLNENPLTILQWSGVAIALYGVWHVFRWLSKQPTEAKRPIKQVSPT